jgi:hypothetical protein
MINLLLTPLRVLLAILPWNLAAPNFVEKLLSFTLFSTIAWSVAAAPRISYPYLNPYKFSGMTPPAATPAEEKAQTLRNQVSIGGHRVIHPVGLYIRRSPGMRSVRAIIPTQQVVQVTGEPVEMDGVLWVPVTYRNTAGWSAVQYLKKI